LHNSLRKHGHWTQNEKRTSEQEANACDRDLKRRTTLWRVSRLFWIKSPAEGIDVCERHGGGGCSRVRETCRPVGRRVMRADKGPDGVSLSDDDDNDNEKKKKKKKKKNMNRLAKP
jgi:hypothetical protein